MYLENLSVNDKAFIYNDFCVTDGSLYVPGWITPADVSGNEYNATGILLKIEVLSGRRLRAQFVDAAQAQSIARGNQKSPPVLDASGYKNAILAQINDLYRATIFGTVGCDELQRENTLRTLTLYSVETLNGFTKISDLLRYAKS